jgi:hypothetical protein
MHGNYLVLELNESISEAEEDPMINFKSALTMAAIAGVGLAQMSLACPNSASQGNLINTTTSSPAVIQSNNTNPTILHDTTKIVTKSVVVKRGIRRDACGNAHRTASTHTSTISKTFEKPVTIPAPKPAAALAPAPLAEEPACLNQPVLLEQPAYTEPVVNSSPIIVNSRDRHHLLELKIF